MGTTTIDEASPKAPLQRPRIVFDDLESVAAVLKAGARARAVADAFAVAGLAAVLLDACGRVLHVAPLAEALFGDALRVEAGHLVGCDAQGNAAIEIVLNGILGGKAAQAIERPVIPVRAGHPLVITAVAFADDSPLQLLRAIVLLGAEEGALRDRLKALDL